MTHYFFDLDGTLAQTGEDITLAWKAALTALNLDLTHFDEIFTIGPTLDKVVYELYPDIASPELVAKLLEEFKPRYDASGFPNTRPYSGIPEFLTTLKDSGKKIYIVTNKRHAATQRIAAKFGWDKIFDGIWSFDSLPEKLKKAELLAWLLRTHNIKPSDGVMIGDTKGDVDAGKANNLTTWGVSWGYGTREELSGADAVFTRVDELPHRG